jgi:hypothetical protein
VSGHESAGDVLQTKTADDFTAAVDATLESDLKDMLKNLLGSASNRLQCVI